MFLSKEILISRAAKYAAKTEIEISGELGFGKDGRVFKTTRRSALKVFERKHGYKRELDAYLRFSEREVTEIRGHTVPQLLGFDHELLAIEITIVQPPYLLDFASAYLDHPPDFPPDAVDIWLEERAELFGDRWRAVQDVMLALESQHRVYLTDINLGSITFKDDAEAV